MKHFSINTPNQFPIGSIFVGQRNKVWAPVVLDRWTVGEGCSPTWGQEGSCPPSLLQQTPPCLFPPHQIPLCSWRRLRGDLRSVPYPLLSNLGKYLQEMNKKIDKLLREFWCNYLWHFMC